MKSWGSWASSWAVSVPRPLLECGGRDEQQDDPADDFEGAVDAFESDADLEGAVERSRRLLDVRLCRLVGWRNVGCHGVFLAENGTDLGWSAQVAVPLNVTLALTGFPVFAFLPVTASAST